MEYTNKLTYLYLTGKLISGSLFSPAIEIKMPHSWKKRICLWVVYGSVMARRPCRLLINDVMMLVNSVGFQPLAAAHSMSELKPNQ